MDIRQLRDGPTLAAVLLIALGIVLFILTVTGVLNLGSEGWPWGVTPLAVGLAALIAYFALGRSHTLLLFGGVVLAIFGLTFLALMWTRSSFEHVGRFAPLALVVIGITLLIARNMGPSSKS